MAIQDCSELTQIIYELSRYYARNGATTVDGVVSAINNKNITREIVTNALYEASTAQSRNISETAKRMRKITQEAKLDKKQRATLEAFANQIEQGKIPTRAEIKATSQQTEAMAQLSLDSTRMAEAIRNMKAHVEVEELNEALGRGEIAAAEAAPPRAPQDPMVREIREQRGEISEDRREISAATRNAQLLEHEMAGTLPETKPQAPRSAVVQEIMDQRSAILKNIGDSPAAQEIRDAKTIEQLKTAIAKLEDHLKNGTLPEIQKTKERSEKVQKWVKARREAEKALRDSEPAVRARLEAQMTRMIDKLQQGDFATPIDEKSVPMSGELADLTFRRDSVRNQINRVIQSTRTRTIWGALAEKSMGFKALKASFDLPPLFRQGVFMTVTNPAASARAFVSGLKAMGPDSERNYYDMMKALRERVNAPLYLRDNLAIKDIGATNMSAGIRAGMTPAEAARGGGKYSVDDYIDLGVLPGKGVVPKLWNLTKEGLDRSGRGFTMYLNQLRADTYDAWAESFTETGVPTPVEGEYIARMVNILTGEGNLGSLERYAPAMNMALFSPRNFIAKLQASVSEPLKAGLAEIGELTGRESIKIPYLNGTLSLNAAGSKKVRRAVARQYAKYMAANLMFYTLLGTLLNDEDGEGAEVITDPTHSMAGAVKIGNTYLDPLGGLRPTLVMFSRLASGTKTTASGKTVDIRGEDVPFKGDTMGGLILQQLRGKLAPAPASLVNYLSNKQDFKGDPVTFGSTFNDLFVPMSGSDMKDAFQEQGIAGGAGISALISLGMGANTFVPKPTKGIKSRN
jgi:hypothetical protein